MKTRMRPIGSVWNELPRVGRDLSLNCGEQVRLEMVPLILDTDRVVRLPAAV